MIKEIGMPEDEDDKMTFSGHELSTLKIVPALFQLFQESNLV